MGKSFELLGMMAFQTFLLLIVSVSIMATSKEKTQKELTRATVENFIHELSDITGGRNKDIDAYGVTEYLMTHLSQDGEYKTLMSINEDRLRNIPEEEIVMDKLEYISNVLQGLKSIEQHKAEIQIEHVDITPDGKEARVYLTNYEEGNMPVPNEDGSYDIFPMAGTSYCEQVLTLTAKKTIQLSSESCTTDISFIE